MMRAVNAKSNVAVIGARGYSGLELCRLLLKHPGVASLTAAATDAQWKLSDFLPEPSAASVQTVSLKTPEAERALIAAADVVFLATPAGASLELAPKCLDAGKHCIDLSGAFRLDAADYPKWYGFEHPRADLLKRAHFGLWPLARADQSPRSPSSHPALISNPGCYATSVILALAPLLEAGVIDPRGLVIDAKSGASGAGRKASETMLFTEVDGECLPYRIGKHQHTPEIARSLARFGGVLGAQASDFHFTTHLIPARRGILSSIYARLNAGKTAADVKAAFEKAFRDYPLARVQEGEGPLLSLKRVVGSARIHLSFSVDGSKLFLFSTIDNLLKGAASQAIESWNGLLGLPPETGLAAAEGVL